MENQILKSVLERGLPTYIKKKIKLFLEEDSQYASDELVELAEAVLNQISAIGIHHYIQLGIHKELYNDFLVQLFTSSNQHNAGPVYRWTANMIKNINNKFSGYQFFWISGSLNKKILYLSELRNQVMHGFFLLPPEKNQEMGDYIGRILSDLISCNFFNIECNYHFIKDGNFKGTWKITVENDWKKLIVKNSLFGKLIENILKEKNDLFWKNEDEKFSNINEKIVLPEKILDFTNNNTRGSYALWINPSDTDKNEYYRSIGYWLKQNSDFITIAYSINDLGITYTSSFFFERLLKIINKENKVLNKKKPEEYIKTIRQSVDKKIILLINNIHIAMFSRYHISKITDFLFENNILFIGIGFHYEYLDRFFNHTEKIDYSILLPKIQDIGKSLSNYLRFKGPFIDNEEDKDKVIYLKSVIEKLYFDLQIFNEIYAHRFAHTYNFKIEYVYEAFAVFHPWIKDRQEVFEQDIIDKNYGFISKITDSSIIYQILEHRDIKIINQQKIISK